MNTYTDISIPVQAGDLLGLHSNGTDRICGSLEAGYTANYFGTDPAPGDSVTTAFTSGLRLDISATLEADCDAEGSEAQEGQVRQEEKEEEEEVT